MKFGDKLRILIEEQGVTQKELANKLNISPSTLGNYIQNTREPDFDTLKLFSAYFTVSIDYLLDYRFEDSISACQSDCNHAEDELLRIFRSLTDNQKEIYLEQGKAFIKFNQKEKAKSSM